jgi:hypothetical protein
MNNTSTIALIAVVAIAGLLIAATALGPTQAFAHKHHKHHHHHSNSSQHASSEISQSNKQSGVCISGGTTTGSCNNAAANINTGNAVAANVR